MNKRHYLLGAAAIGMASVSIASPAMAEDENRPDEEIALDAQGSFTGFRSLQSAGAIVSTDIAATEPQPVVSRSLNGGLLPPTPELIVRDDIGLAGSVDVNNTLPSVVQIFLQNNATGGIFFNCTGTIINPRTVLTAAHCLNSSSSEAYGLPESGAALTMLVGTGVDTRPRLINYLGGAGYADGGLASGTDVVIHPSANLDNGGLPFPWADVAFIALDTPITDVPAMPLLLTPLDSLAHVIVTGYGTRGTGDNGAASGPGSIDFLRRVGENMLGAIASSADLIDAVFPGFAPSAVNLGFDTQALYFIDFDDPDRAGPGEDLCTFSGFGISCPNLEAVKAIDWFDGDALPQEAGTAPGDSGSPLIADQLAPFPLITGVLSGGFDFFGTNNRYGDISFYNPLYPFFEFITENTPYKYVSAKSGNGVWSDASRWTQDLDPGFFIQDAEGNIVNGIPGGSEPGVYEAGPKLGIILGNDISGNSTAPSEVLFDIDGNPLFDVLPESSVLLGPGSTGFVPNNTDGTPGIAFANPAQYFDVLLVNPGRTTVDMDVEIDRLTIDGSETSFRLPSGFEFTSLIGLEQYRGTAEIDGQFNAGNVLLFGGTAGGTGTVSTNAFFNVSGTLAPGGENRIGTFTIDGDYIQTSAGVLLVDAKRAGANGLTFDQLVVTGDASLAGAILVKPTGQITPKFGAEWTVLTANSVLGNFDEAALLTRSPVLFATTRVEGNEVIVEIGARRIAQIVGAKSDLGSLAAALDALRFGGRYADFSGIFGLVDSAGIEVFGQTLAGLTPTSGFQQSFSANGFALRFTGQLSQRTLKRRDASGAAAGFSAAGAAGFAQAGTAPGEGKLGFFGSVSGSYLTMAQSNRNTGTIALQDAAFTEAGELTLGADYKLGEGFSLGFAMSQVHDSAAGLTLQSPMENTSSSGAVYAAASFGQGFADGYFGYSDQRYGMAREVTGRALGTTRSVTGTADGSQTFGGLRIGYALEPARGITVGPVASIDYVRSEFGGYREFGSGQFGLDVNGRSLTSIGAKVGAMASADVALGKAGALTAFGSVAYARELGDTSDVVTASFSGASDLPFTIARQLDQQWMAVNAGAELALSDRFSTRVSITSDIGRGALTNNQASMALNWRF